MFEQPVSCFIIMFICYLTYFISPITEAFARSLSILLPFFWNLVFNFDFVLLSMISLLFIASLSSWGIYWSRCLSFSFSLMSFWVFLSFSTRDTISWAASTLGLLYETSSLRGAVGAGLLWKPLYRWLRLGVNILPSCEKAVASRKGNAGLIKEESRNPVFASELVKVALEWWALICGAFVSWE